jgi:hypothetical protein
MGVLWRMPIVAVATTLALTALGAPLPLRFEKPVLVASSVTDSTDSTHAWFPEGGAVVGSVRPAAGPQAVLTGVRFNKDGGPPLPNHTDECLVSWDAGRTYEHFAWTTYIQGTPTFLDGGAVLHGSANFNTSADEGGVITARALTFQAHVNKTIARSEQPPGSVVYGGFPFPIVGLNYRSAIATLDRARTTLVQTVAFKLDPFVKTDQNLAGFRSTDGGQHWQFQQVIAYRNDTFPPSIRNQTQHSNRTWQYKYYM